MTEGIRDLVESEIARLLTQDEVNQLPDGIEAMVKWSGGNGPWKYIITKRFGQSYAVREHRDRKLGMPIDFVGKQNFHTRVFLPEGNTIDVPTMKVVYCPHCGKETGLRPSPSGRGGRGVDVVDRLLAFYLTFDCPACNQLFEMQALAIEVFYDGLEITCPKCESKLAVRILNAMG